ncbi:class I SAM-dependent methyltransferase [Phaeobacter inhibens]|uniref:class I SAM-dependent methyltransferase n=1 Tax=Phaeobacter inhibens TaxID=221822 RepID=UPI0021A3C290|nr:class I SAM-dependent methyltransferase [Phaeobacter inhibens]UWR98698.1 class I SAM-dependent methyltransferase [Phaeobacter inhibens]
MKEKTKALWEKQDQHKGDRWRLFQAVSAAVPARRVLYAGSYVDVAPSFVYDDVTYADMDKRAAAFFADTGGTRQIICDHGGNVNGRVAFVHGDYAALDLPPESFDLLISLYAGLISEPCGRLLRIGGHFLVNSSHGDAALAALDPRFRLVAVVTSASGCYEVTDQHLDSYMVPRKPQTITRDSLMKSGRGVAYTKSPFAYLFERVL